MDNKVTSILNKCEDVQILSNKFKTESGEVLDWFQLALVVGLNGSSELIKIKIDSRTAQVLNLSDNVSQKTDDETNFLD